MHDGLGRPEVHKRGVLLAAPGDARRHAEVGERRWPPVVRRSRALELVEEEAGVPYAQTALAKKAVRARRRLVALLALGAILFLVESVAARQAGWVLAALFAAGAAWGVRGGRLGGVVSAALLAVLAVLVPLGLAFVGTPDTLALFAMVVSAALGLSALPDVLTLIRDAELQHAYGLWARADDDAAPEPRLK